MKIIKNLPPQFPTSLHNWSSGRQSERKSMKEKERYVYGELASQLSVVSCIVYFEAYLASINCNMQNASSPRAVSAAVVGQMFPIELRE